MSEGTNIDRRRFMSGGYASGKRSEHHISSAVISAFPARCAEVAERLRSLPGVEVHRIENGKIVVVIEAEGAGVIGERLTEMALMDGVLTANLVFDHIDS